MTRKNVVCLWFDGDAVDAAQFYATTFPDSAVGTIRRAPGDFPSGQEGDVLTVELTAAPGAFRSRPLARPGQASNRSARSSTVKAGGRSAPPARIVSRTAGSAPKPSNAARSRQSISTRAA